MSLTYDELRAVQQRARYREELDAAECKDPNCVIEPGQPHPFLVDARCHPDSPVWVSYCEGVLLCECAACRSPVEAFHVSRRPL